MEKDLQRKSGLVSGTCKHGFGLLEILIAIAIIALLGTTIVPNLWHQITKYERKRFIDQLNALSLLAWQQALATAKVHQVLFDLKNKKMSVRIISERRDASGEPEYVALQGVSAPMSASIPEGISIKTFFINRTDMMKQVTNRKVMEVWFLVYPDGVGQEVIINCIDTNKNRQIPLGLVLNPFSTQFDVYDEFQQS